MSQNDFNIANQGFPSFRSDLNSALQALASLSSGDTAPTTTYANQLWYETDTNTSYIRDEANSAWLALMVIDQATGSPSFTAGNVGIGTSSPAAELHVNSGLANLVGLFESTDAGATITLIDDATTGGSVAEHGLNTVGNELEVRAVETLAFQTAATERMRIDSAGNVGIGLTPSTSAPLTNVSAGLLQVNGNVELRYEGANVDPAGARYLNIVNTDTTLVADQPLGGIQWVGLDTDNPNRNMASITSYCSGNTGTTGDLRFKIAGTERARIDSSGVVLVGKTASSISTVGWQLDPSGGGSLVGTVSSGTNEIFSFNNTSTGGTAQVDFRTANVEKGSINWNNTSTSYATSSDYRLKENVQPMQDALSVIAQLNPVTYTWKADGSDGQGFIAHELQAVVPDCVSGEKDAVDAEGNPQYQGVDTSFLVATLVKAVQELKAEVDSLRAQVEAG